MQPHLVALDIDGTTLTHDGQLLPETAEAIREVVAAGHQVVIATGRSVLAMLPVLSLLDRAHGWAVCSNGAVTIELDPSAAQGYRVTDTVTFQPREELARVVEQVPEVFVAVEVVGVGFKVIRPFPDGVIGGEQMVVSTEELIASPTTRMTFYDPDGESEDFLALVERIGLHGVSYSVGFTAWLDIAPEGVSKGSALEVIRQRLGIDSELTVAAGDQRNDIEMLQWAHRGIAMGDAPDEVKAIADEVTGTVDDCGLAEALRPLRGKSLAG